MNIFVVIVCACGWLFGIIFAHVVTPYNQDVSWKIIIEFGIFGAVTSYCLIPWLNFI